MNLWWQLPLPSPCLPETFRPARPAIQEIACALLPHSPAVNANRGLQILCPVQWQHVYKARQEAIHPSTKPLGSGAPARYHLKPLARKQCLQNRRNLTAISKTCKMPLISLFHPNETKYLVSQKHCQVKTQIPAGCLRKELKLRWHLAAPVGHSAMY